MFGLSKLAARAAMIGLAVLALIVFFQVRSCQQAAQHRAESKLQKGQMGAQSESARDAIATQGAAAQRERASDDITRTNEKEIRDAQGADDAVNPAVRDAGLRSLCRRAAYRDTERCRLLDAGSR